VHEFLVMPCRTHRPEDAAFRGVLPAVPVDAPGREPHRRAAGGAARAKRRAKFSGTYGQSTGVVIFEDVFVPHERVFPGR